MDTIEVLKRLMKENDTKVIDLARHLGKNRQTVYNYLNRVTSISIEDLEKLADFYGVKTSYFLANQSSSAQANAQWKDNEIKMLRELLEAKNQIIKDKDSLIQQKDEIIKDLKDKLLEKNK